MMELKKNPNKDLNKYRLLFFNIGLALSIGFVLLVFEWKTMDTISEVRLQPTSSMFEEVIDVPISFQSPPPPPVKLQQPKIIEIPDEEEIIEGIKIDLDIEMTEETVPEQIVIIGEPEEEIADEVFSVVEVMPSFPGGNQEFYAYVSKNLKYPRRALRANVEGKVVLQFVVAEDGDIRNVEVLKGIGYDCDEEAVRVLQSSPNWIPGKQQGRNVKVRVMVPLTFNI
jgi:periplasmic protein TonB